MKPCARRSLPPGQFLLAAAGAVFAGICVADFLALLLIHWGLGWSFAQFAQLPTLPPGLPHPRAGLLLLQALAGLGMGAGALALPLWQGYRIRSYFAPHPLSSAWPLLGASLLILSAGPLTTALADWNATWHLPASWAAVENWARTQEAQAQGLTHTLTQFTSPAQALADLVVLALLPALGEELVFRGLLQRTLGRWLKSPQAGIWLTAAVFSGLHLQFLGFVPRFVLGLALGYFYLGSRNLLVPIVAHFTQNASQLLLLGLALSPGVNSRVKLAAEPAWSWPGVLVSGLLTVGLSYGLAHYYSRLRR